MHTKDTIKQKALDKEPCFPIHMQTEKWSCLRKGKKKKIKEIFALVAELKICLYVDERPKPHGKHCNCVKTNNITHVHADKAFILPLSFSHLRNMCLGLGREPRNRRGTGGILKTANINHQDHSMLRAKQSPRILIVDFHKVLYGFTLQFTEQVFCVHFV